MASRTLPRVTLRVPARLPAGGILAALPQDRWTLARPRAARTARRNVADAMTRRTAEATAATRTVRPCDRDEAGRSRRGRPAWARRCARGGVPRRPHPALVLRRRRTWLRGAAARLSRGRAPLARGRRAPDPRRPRGRRAGRRRVLEKLGMRLTRREAGAANAVLHYELERPPS